jgi:hypothetical protein
MTTSLLVTSEIEPLPLYTRDDPDRASIHSACPSYVSDTPTYTSHRAPTSLLPPLSPTSTAQQSRGLPAVRYAPGFTSRDPSANALSIYANGWSSTRTSNNSRQYNAVARRRANVARADTQALLNSLSAVPPSMASSSSTATATQSSTSLSLPSSSAPTPTASSTHLTTYPVTVGSSSDPVHPLEDPYLVGEEAADRARASRVYREMCLRGDETARYESRSWDFMFGQMADWEERQRSWNVFRKNGVRQTKMLGRRLGLRPR